jgi:hypothetical protein
MILDAEEKGTLQPGGVIVEGTAAIRESGFLWLPMHVATTR